MKLKRRARSIIFKRKDAFQATKNGAGMWIYNGKENLAAVAYQETEVGQSEKFWPNKNAFVCYVIEGTGEWVIEGEHFPFETTDPVVVPPGEKFYFTGCLKQIRITASAWDEQYEEVVKDLNR